ncbi:hypothetical protein IB257_30060 [Achromobacter sp. ACM03]|uniref:DUF6388 family protein n=1 Tax=Achromobacter sp. ACM03 TaxID=2769300 RepID=UPI00177C52BF|nr:DUF6388 family protein [Achromobacter sp. ACM03]MBD9434203.1 hypothetical protein [Achromobacter sp. ACM03]
MAGMKERYEAAIRRGHARFSAENVQCKNAMAAVSQAAAEAVGSSLEEARGLEAWRIARLQASAKGVDVQDFLLELGAESPEELAEFREHQRRMIAQAIGVDNLA